MDEQQVEHEAECFLALYGQEWAVQWAIRDRARRLLDEQPEHIVRRVAKAAGMSHRTLRGFAEVAEQYPPELRSEAHSPRKHAEWVRKDKEGR